MIEPIVSNTTLIANIKVSFQEEMAHCKVSVSFPENEGYWLQIRRVAKQEVDRHVLCDIQKNIADFTMSSKSSATILVYKKILSIDMPIGSLQLLFYNKVRVISNWKMLGVIQQ